MGFSKANGNNCFTQCVIRSLGNMSSNVAMNKRNQKLTIEMNLNILVKSR